MKLNLKELILFSILGAIMAIGKNILSFLPNIEVVSLLAIIFTLVYGKKTLYIILVFVIITGLTNGFGMWWLGYMIIWPILVLVTILLKVLLKENYLLLAIYSAIFGLCFGAMYALPYLFIGNWTFAFTYWIRGLPYDFIHMVGNYFLMLFLGKVVYDLLIKLNKNYFRE